MTHHSVSSEFTDDESDLAGLLVDANHILYSQGVLDGFGHVSVRSTADEETFFLSRNLAPALVCKEDVQRFDLEGNTNDTRRAYLERYIHASIYRLRPDVGAVVHSHSLNVVPYSVVNNPLRPVMHMAGFLRGGTPVFEIREESGNTTDLLIRNNKQGDALATALGSGSVLLMRGHGSVAVGSTIKESVFNAVYTEKNAQVQAQASAIGDPEYLTKEEAQAAEHTNASQIDRAWDFWRMTSVKLHHA